MVQLSEDGGFGLLASLLPSLAVRDSVGLLAAALQSMYPHLETVMNGSPVVVLALAANVVHDPFQLLPSETDTA